MVAENENQIALRMWIMAGLKIPEVCNLKGDAGYLLNNMIAKYTLFADHYSISKAAFQKLKKDRVNLNEIHIRRKFYGKTKPFMYEHSIPATIIRTEMIQSDKSVTTIKKILKQAGKVALILRTEDKMLKDAKLAWKMPPGWKLGDDPEARYKAVGIQISGKLLRVGGAVVR